MYPASWVFLVDQLEEEPAYTAALLCPLCDCEVKLIWAHFSMCYIGLNAVQKSLHPFKVCVK